MNRFLILIVFSLILSGCAAPLSIDRLQDFTPTSNVLVLLESSRFDVEIRKALSKKGFKTLKYSSIDKVVSKGTQNEISRVYNEAEARYGLSFYWEKLDYCLFNSSKKINGTFEITDLGTNEVLLVIEKGGWTGDCAYHKGGVFDELATTLRSEWK